MVPFWDETEADVFFGLPRSVEQNVSFGGHAVAGRVAPARRASFG
jgi:hypothetical protein